MRALVLWADHRSANLGVRALAEGTAALIRRTWPDAEIVLQNFGKGPAPLPMQTSRGLVRERLTGAAGLVRWLGDFDLVVDTRSGDSFADIYGQRRLRTMTTMAELVSQSGTPLVLGPQTIGPFGTHRGRLMARWTLHRATAVLARDSASAEQSAALGRPVDATTTDVVFAIDQPRPDRERDVVLNVSGLLWQPSPHVDAAGYRSTVLALHAALVAAGREVTLLAHVLDNSTPDADPGAVREVAELVGGSDVVIPTSLGEVRSVVAGAQVVIGSRMHACLNALSVGTPAIPLAYSRKFAPLLDGIAWPHTVDLRSSTDPVAEVLAALETPGLAQAAEHSLTVARSLLTSADDAVVTAVGARS